MRHHHLALLAAVLTLTGAGCLSSGSSSNTGGVWQSPDGGKSWEATNALPSASGVGSIAAADVTNIEIDPSDASAVYIGTETNGMLWSIDGGASWMRPEEELLKGGAGRAVEVDPRDVCTYFVMKTDRVLKTKDCGRTFDADAYVETGTDESLTAMVLDWYNPDVLWLGNSAGDIMRSRDGGGTWTTVYRVKGDVTSIVMSNTDSRIILVGTKSKGVYRTADGGGTWTEYEDALKDFKGADKVTGFAQTANGSVIAMSSDYGLLVSKDNGLTWTDVPLLTARGEVEILALAVAPGDGGIIVYGTATTLYRSTSGGSAWDTSELPASRAAGALMIAPAPIETMFLGTVARED